MDVIGRKGTRVDLLQGVSEAYADLIIGMTRDHIGSMFARMEFALVKAGAMTEEQLRREHFLETWRDTPPEAAAPEPVPATPTPVAPATAAAS